MKDEGHLSEEEINMYLDGELSAEKRDHVELHLITCMQCRAEVESLRRLFVTLDKLVIGPAPNLTPGVLRRIGHKPQHSWRTWLIPAFQTASAVVLFALSWSSIITGWEALNSWISGLNLSHLWSTAMVRSGEIWMTVDSWIDHVSAWPSEFLAWESSLHSLDLPLAWLLLLISVAALAWLIANVLLLRHVCRNGAVASKLRHGGV